MYCRYTMIILSYYSMLNLFYLYDRPLRRRLKATKPKTIWEPSKIENKNCEVPTKLGPTVVGLVGYVPTQYKQRVPCDVKYDVGLFDGLAADEKRGKRHARDRSTLSGHRYNKKKKI